MSTASAWFAARQSGTANMYRIYAESFAGETAASRILQEEQAVVDAALGGRP